MKKNKDYTLIAILIPFLIAVISSSGCYSDQKVIAPDTNKHDYQLDIHFDTVWLYDNERYVGRCMYNKIDSLIDADNY